MERKRRKTTESEEIQNDQFFSKNTVKMGPADAILVSDLHLTDKTPVSRKDDYLKAQIGKLQFLQNLSNENNHCPILCAGDVFDYWKASPALCKMAHSYLPRPFYTIPGQHDLPMHSVDQFNKSGLFLISSLDMDDQITVLLGQEESFSKFQVTGLIYGDDLNLFNPEEELVKDGRRKILMIHQLVWKGGTPPWTKDSWIDKDLIKKFGKEYDVILCGDNHSGFVTKSKDCIVVNPGSMLRMNSDQADYIPKCYLYYAKENDVVEIEYPIEKNVHELPSYIYDKKEKEERIASYIERMKKEWDIGLSFEKNLQAFFEANKVSEKVKEIIWEHLEMKT